MGWWCLHPPGAAAGIGPNGSGSSVRSHYFSVLAVTLFLPPRELVMLGQGCVLGPSLRAPRRSCSHTEVVPVSACLSPCPRRPHPTQLYQHVPDSRWPIVYSPRYNITFLGLEKLHPFDAGKWGKVISFLKGMEGPPGTCICPLQPSAETTTPCCLSLTQASDPPRSSPDPQTAFHPSCHWGLPNTNL